MDDERFDAISQTLSGGTTRRAVCRLLSGGALAGMAGWQGYPSGLTSDEVSERKTGTSSRSANSR